LCASVWSYVRDVLADDARLGPTVMDYTRHGGRPAMEPSSCQFALPLSGSDAAGAAKALAAKYPVLQGLLVPAFHYELLPPSLRQRPLGDQPTKTSTRAAADCASAVPPGWIGRQPGVRPVCSAAKASMSAYSAASIRFGLPGPCPVAASIRSRTGASAAWSCWSSAPNL
jgi:hypothetical protein